jgi:LacI family transcriptional regulator
LLTPPVADVDAVIDMLNVRQTPYVKIAPGDRADIRRSVFTNDREVCSEMTRYLASPGHEAIAFIRGHPDHKAIADRYAGYRDGLTDSGLQFDERLVQQGFNDFASGPDNVARASR